MSCRRPTAQLQISLWCPTSHKLVNSEQESRPCHVCPRAVGMVTGRSVSRTIRDWVVARRRRRIQDRQRLQTSTLATHSTPASMLATSIASTSTWVTTQHSRTMRAWTPGQHPTTLDCCTTQRKQPVSSLAVGTSAPTHTWPSRASAKTADCWTDVS